MLEKLLKSRSETRILGVVLFSDALHLREMARRAGISAPEAKRELENLLSLRVLRVERRGNQLIFHPNEGCPFLPELRGLYLKTEGAFGKLRAELERIDGIKYAFVYGSAARGASRQGSDIDLLIIGNAPDEIISEKLFKLQKELLGIPINFIIWTVGDFEKKVRGKSAFMRSVLSNRKEWLVGDADEFGRAAKKTAGGQG